MFRAHVRSAKGMAAGMGVAPADARLFMAFDGRWTMMHAEGGFRPTLFDLETDPQELTDLGASPDRATVRARLCDRLAARARRGVQRITVSDDDIRALRGHARAHGIVIGAWDLDDADPAMRSFLMTGRAAPRPG